MDNSKILIIDNVDGQSRVFHNAILSAIKGDGILPIEISDLMTLRVERIGEKIKAYLNWA